MTDDRTRDREPPCTARSSPDRPHAARPLCHSEAPHRDMTQPGCQEDPIEVYAQPSDPAKHVDERTMRSLTWPSLHLIPHRLCRGAMRSECRRRAPASRSVLRLSLCCRTRPRNPRALRTVALRWSPTPTSLSLRTLTSPPTPLSLRDSGFALQAAPLQSISERATAIRAVGLHSQYLDARMTQTAFRAPPSIPDSSAWKYSLPVDTSP